MKRIPIHRCGLLLAASLLLAACGRAPDAESLGRDVQARLAAALPAETVKIEALHRRGSQSDTKAPEGHTRRIVYYDVDLKLARDFNFGAWDSPGVAGLVSAFGTGPKGISGITSGGNKAGDAIRVHATALYEKGEGGWTPVAPAGYAPAAAPAYAGGEPQNRAAALLQSMQKVIESMPKDANPVQRAMIEEELAAAHAAIRARLARASDGYAIAAGPEHGQYLRFAQALSARSSLRMVPLVTRGGEENLRMLQAGKAPLALVQGDTALAAYEGREPFQDGGPDNTLRAIGSLYPEPVHVLVRADQRVLTVADLRGKRIAIGVPGSASRTAALRVLQAHQLGPKDYQAVEIPLGDALTALRRQEVAAVVQVIGVPADSIRDAVAETPLRLLPLSAPAVASLVTPGSGLFASTIARGSYANQADDVRTVATTAVLLVGRDLSDAEVTALTRFVYDKGRDFAALGSAQGSQVGPATATQQLPVPQHQAAAAALAALGAASAAAR
ncbi:TAXI family TRAP transporter solute-binding subunit [Roseateles violae]|uniref:TAXI family TRAP transporter solute-binding subunit n=1 Tax=Roseateles violae TaxID=3058042 RepID=A0ABT8DNY1_9BURK|nr:TAXI family TRAP transporter solute-binding subunit [Pelomonas sp. PFR6]MDN3919683.1 TAXI family TRAP transporter solute-binding subunit [Pelomonas sp. PFR6]